MLSWWEGWIGGKAFEINMFLISQILYRYDFLGDGSTTTGGPIMRPSLLPWNGVYSNIAYNAHPCKPNAQTESYVCDQIYEHRPAWFLLRIHRVQ
jgi:hypothetical protein